MKSYQRQFIEFSINNHVLQFGEFKLKSGRISPYFFNSGLFKDGNAFYQLSHFYANTINDNFNQEYDVLFGPAYKGISLATAASIGLMTLFQQNIPVSFNRKEIKDHGEGGNIIGADLAGKRVLLIDDVITAGTTIRESVDLINSCLGKLVGIVIALDRQERGKDSKFSTTQQVQKEFNLKVSSIITLDHLISCFESRPPHHASLYLPKISDYRAKYGTA